MPKLEGTLPTIAVIGGLLPMLGLLGTVTGMINVFEVVAVHGTGNPQEMAYGISQALLTTASGLIIAIPVIFCHHLLSRRLRYTLAVTEQSLQHIQQRIINS
jgi:biopolymer transport protein ExbB